MASQPHALLFPFPVVGHINPMLQLAFSLSSNCGFKVTLLTTDYRLSQIRKTTQEEEEEEGLVSFYGIPDGLSDEDHEGPIASVKLFGAVGRMAANGVFDKVLEDLQKKKPPVSCIISDTFVSWTQTAADKVGIPRAAFWTSCASSYVIHHYTPLLVTNGHLPLKEESQDFTKNDGGSASNVIKDIPGVCPLPADKLPSVLQVSNISDMAFNAFLRLFENDRKCSWLIINSYHDLEQEQFKILKSSFPVLAVGPLLPSNLLLKSPASKKESNNLLQMFKEDNSCLQWLDSKPASSVIYVSFGSIASLQKEELHQLALGLENSKKYFLWVVRGFNSASKSDDTLPEGFLGRTQEQGLILSWAPQLQVLAHPAVGGFLTHCGWNSTIESLSLGVPLLGMPTDFGEQKTTAWLIEHMWRVGLQLQLDRGGLLSKGEVENAVKAVMEGEQSGVFRRNAAHLSEAAKRAILHGGSSHHDLQIFADDMKKRTQCC